MKLYLAGPMRGYPDFNFPEFHAKAKMLRDAGYDVFNPAEHDEETISKDGRKIADLTIRECMKADTAWICDNADGIALLSGWDKSTGAQAEVALGKAIGIPHNFVVSWVQQAKQEVA